MPDAPTIESDPASAMRNLWLAMENCRAAWRRALGISAYEMLALINVRDRPLTIGELGQRLALTSGAMTGLVDRLERAELLERVADPGDRRRFLIHATTQAQQRLAELEAEWAKSVHDAFHAVPAPVRDIVMRLLGELKSVHERLALELAP